MTEIDHDNFSVFSKWPLNALGEILLKNRSIPQNFLRLLTNYKE